MVIISKFIKCSVQVKVHSFPGKLVNYHPFSKIRHLCECILNLMRNSDMYAEM